MERVASMNRKPVPQVVAVAEWLMEKDDKLSREDALRMGAEIANTGKLDAVDASRTKEAEAAFQKEQKQNIMLVALEKDQAKKKALQDALDAEKEKVYKRFKVKSADGVSSEQGGATQSGNTRVRLDAQGNIIK